MTTRTNRLEAALSNVEKLLDGRITAMKKATTGVKAKPKKAAPVKKAATKKPVKSAKPVRAAAKPAPKKGSKVTALSKPNLLKLKRLIDRGAIDVEEFIAAVVEGLRSQRVKTPVVGGMAQLLRKALAEVDVIDVGDYTEAPGQGGFGPGLVPLGE